MKYHELSTLPRKNRKRVGRGISAGQGKTAGRGTKGQKARTGKKLGYGFKSRLQQVPKLRGFKSLRVPAQVVYLQDLAAVKGKTADNQSLFEAGLVATPYHSIKVITRGELSKPLVVKIQAASAQARAAIEKAGGSFEKVDVPILPASKKKSAE